MFLDNFMIFIDCDIESKKISVHFDEDADDKENVFNLEHLSVNNIVYCMNEFLVKYNLLRENPLEIDNTNEIFKRNFSLIINRLDGRMAFGNNKYRIKAWTVNDDENLDFSIVSDIIYEILSRDSTFIPKKTIISN